MCPGGYSNFRRSGGLAPKFASEILVGAPNFASKNIGDKYPKFCLLNFRFDPKFGIFSQLLRLVVTELSKFFSYLVNLAGPCPKFCLQTLCEVQAPPPPDLLIWKYPSGIMWLSSHPSHQSLCFNSKLVLSWSKLALWKPGLTDSL